MANAGVSSGRSTEMASGNRERLLSFLDVLSDGVVLFDGDGTVRSVNNRLTDLIALSARRLKRNHLDPVRLFLGEGLSDGLPKVLAGEEVPPFRIHRPTDTGESMWFEVRLVAGTKAAGIAEAVAIVRDISEQHRLETDLENANERARVFLENSDEGIVLFEDDVRIFMNQRVAALTGRAIEELATKSFVEYVHPDDKALVKDYHEKRHRGEPVPRSYPFRIVRPDGSARWAETVSITYTVAGKQFLLSIVKDITERKEAEDALREAKAKLDLLVQQIPCFCWTLDMQLVFTSCAGALMAGRTPPGEMVGKSLVAYYEGTAGLPVSAHRQAVAGTGTSYEQKLGEQTTIYCRVEPLYDAGKQVGVVGTAIDITEYRKLVVQLRSLSRKLFTVQEDERRAMAGELHDEIGQFLTALKFLLEKIQDAAPEHCGPQLAEARGAIAELLSRVREITLDLHPPMLDDLGLLPTVLSYFKRYTARTGVNVRFRHAGLRRLLSPALNITVYRIVQEALTNVARYARVDEVSVCIRATRSTISVEIEDKGAGFDEANVSLDCSGIRGMRERALALDGRLTVKSAPGEGTRVTAELPLRAASPANGTDLP